jgi:hypothetical protein
MQAGWLWLMLCFSVINAAAVPGVGAMPENGSPTLDKA